VAWKILMSASERDWTLRGGGEKNRPADFDRFWKEVRETARRHRPEVRLTSWEQEDPDYEGEYILDWGAAGGSVPREAGNPYDFRWNSHLIATGFRVRKLLFRSFDGQEVGGLLQLPFSGERRTYPAVVHFTGYGGELMLDQDLVSAGYAVLNFSHRGMLLGSESFDRYRPVPLLVRGVEDPHGYVYRSIAVDCLLSLEAVRGLDMIDGGRVGVMGTSQGGALSLMMGALDETVKAVSCDLPWLTFFEYQLAHEVEGPYNELKEYIRRNPDKKDAALNTLSYFDTLSFAGLLGQPVLVSLGHEDTTSPAESVRRLFREIGSVKALLELPDVGHQRSTLWRHLTRCWFDYYL
jgi:cephalosporin-C deacetylase